MFNALLWTALRLLFCGIPKTENRGDQVVWYAGMATGPILTGFLCAALGYVTTSYLAIVGLIGIPLARYLLAPISTKTEDFT